MAIRLDPREKRSSRGWHPVKRSDGRSVVAATLGGWPAFSVSSGHILIERWCEQHTAVKPHMSAGNPVSAREAIAAVLTSALFLEASRHAERISAQC